MDLNKILEQVLSSTQQSNANILAAGNQHQASINKLETLGNQDAAISQELIGQAGIAQEQAAEINFQRALVGEQAQRIVGLDPDDMENQLVKSLAMLDSAQQQRAQARARFDELSTTNPLTNPIGYILAQLELPAAAAEHNKFAAMERDASTNIAQRTAMLSSYKSSVAANTSNAVRDMELQQARVQRLQAQLQANEVEARNTARIAGMQLQQTSVMDKINDNNRQAIQMQLSTAQFAMSLQERAEARAERAAAAAIRLKQQEDEEVEIATLNGQLQRLSTFLGMPPGTLTVETLKRMPDKKRAQMYFDAAVTGSLGQDMRASMALVMTNPTALPVLRQHDPGVAQFISAGLGAVDNYKATLMSKVDPRTGKAMSEKEAIPAAFAEYQDEVVKSASAFNFSKPLNSTAWDSTFNPYRVQYRVLNDEVKSGRIPNLTNNKVAQLATTLESTVPQDATNFRGEDETRLVRTIVEKVKSKELSIQEAAAQLNQFYAFGVAKTSELYKYEIFNLPPQTRYMVTIPGQGMFGRSVAGDLMNRASTEKMLTEMLVSTTPSMNLTGGPVMDTLFNRFQMGAQYGVQQMQKGASGPIADFLRGYELPEKPAEKK